MFKQIFRITFVTLIWKQYKGIIVSTLLLFAFLWLVGGVHEDYLVYATDQKDEGLIGRSFLYKWMALISGVLLYLSYHWLRTGSSKKVTKSPSKTKFFSQKESEKTTKKPFSTEGEDPFAQLREKEKLRSRAEMLVDEQKHS